MEWHTRKRDPCSFLPTLYIPNLQLQRKKPRVWVARILAFSIFLRWKQVTQNKWQTKGDLAGGLGNLVSPRGNQRKQVSLPAPAQKMATTYILSQLCVTKEYLNNILLALKSNGRPAKARMNLPETVGSVSRIHTKFQLLHLAIQLQPHSETWPKQQNHSET